MAFQVMGKTKDQRSGANVIYCKCNIDEYLEIIGNDFENFTIQRKRENHKAYGRLKQDIVDGALLPSITLAVKHHLVNSIVESIGNNKELINKLSKQGSVDILDGLQRTYIINELKEAGTIFKEGQELLLEFWLEPDMGKLIYRMIVLNAGQKAMSMRHQIELLFMSLKETVSEKIDGLEIFVERDGQRRTTPNKYSLGVIASAYQAFMTKTTELDKSNIVAQELNRDSVLDASEAEMTERFKSFIEYFNIIKSIDEHAWNYYSQPEFLQRYEVLNAQEERTHEEELEYSNMKVFKKSHSWLGSENVFLALFCAIAVYSNSPKEDRMRTALAELSRQFEKKAFDPLGLIKYEEIRSGINPRKSNVGVATRKLLLNCFKEFFREDGDTSMQVCWGLAAD